MKKLNEVTHTPTPFLDEVMGPYSLENIGIVGAAMTDQGIIRDRMGRKVAQMEYALAAFIVKAANCHSLLLNTLIGLRKIVEMPNEIVKQAVDEAIAKAEGNV